MHYQTVMPPEIIALIDKPWLLAAVLAVGAICRMAVERVAENMKRAERRAYWKGRNSKPKGDRKVVPIKPVKPEPTDIAADQLRHVMRAQFTARPLLNKGEQRLLTVLDKALAEESPGWRAMGQVSLGEILASPDKDAYFAVNSKRVDLLIVDALCKPLHAVEFQGKGHHTGENTAARDAVKREALRRAGIGYVEVVSGDTPAEVREMVRKLVGRVGV
ncbi:DUF2726 domain-containing protein [Allopontixanthobacter confluentis]